MDQDLHKSPWYDAYACGWHMLKYLVISSFNRQYFHHICFCNVNRTFLQHEGTTIQLETVTTILICANKMTEKKIHIHNSGIKVKCTINLHGTDTEQHHINKNKTKHTLIMKVKVSEYVVLKNKNRNIVLKHKCLYWHNHNAYSYSCGKIMSFLLLQEVHIVSNMLKTGYIPTNSSVMSIPLNALEQGTQIIQHLVKACSYFLLNLFCKIHSNSSTMCELNRSYYTWPEFSFQQQ